MSFIDGESCVPWKCLPNESPIYQSTSNTFLKNLGKDILEETLFSEAEIKICQ